MTFENDIVSRRKSSLSSRKGNSGVGLICSMMFISRVARLQGIDRRVRIMTVIKWTKRDAGWLMDDVDRRGSRYRSDEYVCVCGPAVNNQR